MEMDLQAKIDAPLDDVPHSGGGNSRGRAPFSREPRQGAQEGRTVYVGNLSWSTQWQELKDHMRTAGEVLFADILVGHDGRSKGCAIVEYATAAQAQNAIQTLNDTNLDGRLIFVREDREISNEGGFSGHRGGRGGQSGGRGGRGGRGGFGHSFGGHASNHSNAGGSNAAAAAASSSSSTSGLRVYVGNLSWGVTWQRLKDHFKQAGEVAFAEVLCSPDGRSKGCGIVEFADASGAQAAISMLNDTQLEGRVIFVREDREERS